MRVVVCPDVIGPLRSSEAVEALAAGWAGHEVVRRPSGVAGGGFVVALAAQWGVEVNGAVVEGRLVTAAFGADRLAIAVPGSREPGPIPVEATSAPLGVALRAMVEQYRAQTVFLDLVSDDVHDGGAGFRSALGDSVDGLELVGVVPESELDRLLLGLRGITSLRGRQTGEDAARMLAVDAGLADLAAGWGVADRPGAGACGGVGLAVLALGGRLATGPEVTLADLVPPVDVVVTGCTSYDFASRGGGVVASAARLAERLLCPCIVLAGEVLIGGREMRTMGVEAAYGLDVGAGEVTVEALRALAVRVGRSWRW